MKSRFRIFFGLRYSRIPAWIRDVWAEKPGLSEFIHMGIMSIKAALAPVSKKEYFHRMLVCYHCPVFNRKLKSCRNGEQGCGCYVPYKAIAPVKCWLNESDASKGWEIPEKA
jgi:hypothetical protein